MSAILFLHFLLLLPPPHFLYDLSGSCMVSTPASFVHGFPSLTPPLLLPAAVVVVVCVIPSHLLVVWCGCSGGCMLCIVFFFHWPTPALLFLHFLLLLLLLLLSSCLTSVEVVLAHISGFTPLFGSFSPLTLQGHSDLHSAVSSRPDFASLFSSSCPSPPAVQSQWWLYITQFLSRTFLPSHFCSVPSLNLPCWLQLWLCLLQLYLVLIPHIFTPLGCSHSCGCLGVLIAFKLVIAALLVTFTLLSLCSLSNSLYLCHILIAAAV
jgi:hypothetical protein